MIADKAASFRTYGGNKNCSSLIDTSNKPVAYFHLDPLLDFVQKNPINYMY